jgi:uracil-DNA glycosylase
MSTTLKRKANNAPMGGSDAKKPKADADITSFFGRPRTAPVPAASTVQTPATPLASMAAVAANAGTLATVSKFNKEKWAAGLTDEQRDLLRLEIDTLDASWLVHLKDDIVTREFLDLKRFLRREISAGKKIFPPQEDVYSWWVLLRVATTTESPL